MPSRMINTYIGGSGQRTQSHLSIWVNLCMIINQNSTISLRRTDITNAGDNGIEIVKGLEIRRGNGV